jgi:SAM-dependent methyltransferase
MFKAEAIWLRRKLDEIPAEALSPLVNLGSSTGAFRANLQFWTEEQLFAPLRARGVRLVHVDRREEDDGIDIRADLMDDRGLAEVKAVRPRAALCCNLLEHVEDPAALARRCMDVVLPGGYLFVTVPNSYPYHRDPIDTMFRPTPEEIAALLPNEKMITGEIIDVEESYLDEVRKRPWIVLRHVIRFPFPFVQPHRWKRNMRKLHWLTNNYRVTCAVFRKAGEAA